jgi:regulator of sirC expression with transglutaminase-like and TPR domain
MELDTTLIRLDCAALHLARDVYPDLSMPRHLRQLDQIAERVAESRPGLSATARYRAMRDVICGEFSLTGNQKDYYDPENIYLNRVLDRGVGIPISLSIVWLEVARRLKWPVVGVNFPGHFLVRFDDAERFVLVDPFRDGRTLSPEDCQKILDHAFTETVSFKSELLRPADTRLMLVRALNNLRGIYFANQDWPRLADVLRRLMAVEPQEKKHREELSELNLRCGDVRAAYVELASFAESHPAMQSDEVVQRKLDRLQAAIAALN